jgi:hypothetical protein
MESIGISEVLNKISDTVDVITTDIKHYGVRYLTEEGENRELNVRKYTRGLKQSVSGVDKRGKGYYNIQKNGVVLVQDLTNGRTISLKAAMIYGFRDFESNFWNKVFH